MHIPPVLAALKRHRTTALLVVLQVAVTLAVSSNAWFIARQRIAHLSRPTGIAENDIAVLHAQWIGQHDAQQLNATMLTDLAILRQLPGVVDAYADYSYPAAGPMAQLLEIGVTAGQAHPTSFAEAYFTDAYAIPTLGIDLVAGRNFRSDEIAALSASDALPTPASIIVTQDLATALFPRGNALGQRVYFGGPSSTIIGIVRRLQVPALNTNSFAYRSVLLPYRLLDPDGTYYMLRAQPGQLDSVLQRAPAALLAAERMHVIAAEPYRALRDAAYAQDRGIATLMGIISAILLAATAGGILGLSSFWVEQRRKKIGVRRALGATRADIRRYFQIENFLLVSIGSALGTPLALALHASLMRHYELRSLPLTYPLLCAALLWCLGQVAVLGPSLRATQVPPVEATRSV